MVEFNEEIEEMNELVDEPVEAETEIESFELTLEELDNLSQETKKFKADETQQKVLRFVSQKKVATITKNIKGKEIYQLSSSSGTLLVAKFESQAPKLELEDMLKKETLTWTTIKEEVVEGVKRTSYKATHSTLGNIYYTAFYSVPKKGQKEEE